MALNTADIKSSFEYSSKAQLMVLTTDYSTSNYPPDDDSTSSGGSGSPQDAWSTPAQRGRHFPSHMGAPDNSAYPYSPGPFSGSSASFYSSPGTPGISAINVPVDPSANKSQALAQGTGADSWDSRLEAVEILTKRYRDSIEARDH